MGKRKSTTLERHALTKNQLNYQVYLKLLLCWFSKSVLTIIRQILFTCNHSYSLSISMDRFCVQSENKMCPWMTVYIVQFIYNMSGQLLNS